MRYKAMVQDLTCHWIVSGSATVVLAVGLILSPATVSAQTGGGQADPRVGLEAGWQDAEAASSNLELRGHRDRPPGFFVPGEPGAQNYKNSDLAFRGDLVFVGNYNGFNIYDIADPVSPELLTSVVCPGAQGDLSIYGDLLFRSDQEARSRLDCGVSTEEDIELDVNAERFRGVRIFDVSDIQNPVQVAAVQTCRGSHTHTILSHPNDNENVYLYVSGTSAVRSGEELEGCLDIDDPDEPDTSFWRISVIQVPLDAPENARVVNEPRVFANPESGSIAGLWGGGDHGPGTQESRQTTSCHDITVYPEIGLAAGACQGNGVLFDISDPVNPIRIEEVTDPNFAYWHSATFNNDGSKVVFTDEWGGGGQPRCLSTDPTTWGADAVFDVIDGELHFAGYYKLPAPQTETENCVAHNGSLIPVPGRDIMVQAWYQGGLSVFDFTDSENPTEIAYFDRGPVSESELLSAGYWSTYWYNGYIYGSEISRGLDVFELTASEHLSQNEIDAANLVLYETFNPQEQPRVVWPAAFVVARAYLDQLIRVDGLAMDRIAEVAAELDAVEAMDDGPSKRAALAELATQLWDDARQIDANQQTGDEERVQALAGAILDLAAVQR